jgi:INO80 complex subunit B
MSLDFGGKKKFVPEEIQQEQRAIKSQKRKELELVKREEDKKKTMDRLLLKKDSKAAKMIKATSKRSASHNVPKWTYKLTADGATISVPVGSDYPVKPTKILAPPTPTKCIISDCQNLKRYSCSKTGKPLCSLACYSKNLASISV